MDKKSVLVIDDEPGFCETVRSILEIRCDLKTYVAINGRDGLKLAKKFKPNLIILDIRMPRMDGFEVLRRLKEDTGTVSIPVIMLSALDDDMSKIKSSGLYCETYITKPISVIDFQTKVEGVLSRT
jgi:DNA-binding response OmpR family regulator